jgi:NSS family neurotransmitter:Na+ symporter
MAIFGSYIGKERSLSGEGVFIIVLDTLVALLAGFIIFPICFSYGVSVDQGPGLVFVSLPAVFNQLPFPKLIGGAFFIFLLLAAVTTLIAVIENLVACGIDEMKLTRAVSSLLVTVLLLILSLPCAFSGNLLSHIQPLGKGSTILDFEDFLVSQNLLPLGALFVCVFVVSRYGWGWENLLAEVNSGSGYKIGCGKWYVKWVLPLLILAVFICGYCF